MANNINKQKKWKKLLFGITSVSLIFAILPLIINNNIKSNQKKITTSNEEIVQNNLDNEQKNKNGSSTKGSVQDILMNPHASVDLKKNSNYAPFNYRVINEKPWKRLIGQKGVLNIQEQSSANKIKFLYTPVGYNDEVQSSFLYEPFVFEYDFTKDITRFRSILGDPNSIHQIYFCGGIYNESLDQYVTIFSIQSTNNNAYYYFPYVIDDKPQAIVSGTNIYQASTVHCLNYYLYYWWNNNKYTMQATNAFSGPSDYHYDDPNIDIHKEIKIIPYYEYNPDYHPDPVNGEYDWNNPNSPKPQNRSYESFLIIPANGEYATSTANLFNHYSGHAVREQISQKITSFNIEKNRDASQNNQPEVSNNGYRISQPMELMSNFVNFDIGNNSDPVISLRPMYLTSPSSSNDYSSQMLLINGYTTGDFWSYKANRQIWIKFLSTTNSPHILYDKQLSFPNSQTGNVAFPTFLFGMYGNSLTNNYYVDLFNAYKPTNSMYNFTLISSFYFFPWTDFYNTYRTIRFPISEVQHWSFFMNLPLAINKNGNSYSIANVEPWRYSFDGQKNVDVDWENVYFDYISSSVYAYQTWKSSVGQSDSQRCLLVNLNWSYFMNFEMPNHVENTTNKYNAVDYWNDFSICGIVNEPQPLVSSNIDYYKDFSNLPIPLSMNLRDRNNKYHKSFIYYYSFDNGAQQYFNVGSSNARLLKENINDWDIAPDKSINAITAKFLEEQFYKNENYNRYFKTFNNYVNYDKYLRNYNYVQYPYNQHVEFEILPNIDGDATSNYILRFKMKMKTDTKLVNINGASSQNAHIPENEFPILSNNFTPITAKESAPKPLYILNAKNGSEIFEIRGFLYESSGLTRVNQTAIIASPELISLGLEEFKVLNAKNKSILKNFVIQNMKKTVPIISSMGAIVDIHPNDWIDFLAAYPNYRDGILYVRFKLPWTINSSNEISNNSLIDTFAIYGFNAINNVTGPFINNQNFTNINRYAMNVTSTYSNNEQNVCLVNTNNGLVNYPKDYNGQINQTTIYNQKMIVLSQYYLHNLGLRFALIYDSERPNDYIFRFYNDINLKPGQVINLDDYEKEISFSNNSQYTNVEEPLVSMFNNKMIPVQNNLQQDMFLIYPQGSHRMTGYTNFQVENNNKMYFINPNSITKAKYDSLAKNTHINSDDLNESCFKSFFIDLRHFVSYTLQAFFGRSTILSTNAQLKTDNILTLNVIYADSLDDEVKYSKIDIDLNLYDSTSNKTTLVETQILSEIINVDLNNVNSDSRLYSYPATFSENIIPIIDSQKNIKFINLNTNESLTFDIMDPSNPSNPSNKTINVFKLVDPFTKTLDLNSNENYVNNLTISQDGKKLNFTIIRSYNGKIYNSVASIENDKAKLVTSDFYENNPKQSYNETRMFPILMNDNNLVDNNYISALNISYDNNQYDLNQVKNSFNSLSTTILNSQLDKSNTTFDYYSFLNSTDNQAQSNFIKQIVGKQYYNVFEIKNLAWYPTVLNDYYYETFSYDPSNNILNAHLTLLKAFDGNNNQVNTKSFPIAIKFSNNSTKFKNTQITFKDQNSQALLTNANPTYINYLINHDLQKFISLFKVENLPNGFSNDDIFDQTFKPSLEIVSQSQTTNQVKVSFKLKQIIVNDMLLENQIISFNFNCKASKVVAQTNDYTYWYYDDTLGSVSASDFAKQIMDDPNCESLLKYKNIIAEWLKNSCAIYIDPLDIFFNNNIIVNSANGEITIGFSLLNPYLNYNYRTYIFKLTGFSHQLLTKIVQKPNYKKDITPSLLQSYLNVDIDTRAREFVDVMNPGQNTIFKAAVVNSFDDIQKTATITFVVENFIGVDGVSKPGQTLNATISFNNLSGAQVNAKTKIDKIISVNNNLSTKIAQEVCANDIELINIINANLSYKPDNAKITIIGKSFNNMNGKINLIFTLDSYLDVNNNVINKPLTLETEINNFIHIYEPTSITLNSSIKDLGYDLLYTKLMNEHDYNFILDYLNISNPVNGVNPTILNAGVYPNQNGFEIAYEVDKLFIDNNQTGNNHDIIIASNYQIFVNFQRINNTNNFEVNIVISDKQFSKINNLNNNNSNNSNQLTLIICISLGSLLIFLLITYLLIRKRLKK